MADFKHYILGLKLFEFYRTVVGLLLNFMFLIKDIPIAIGGSFRRVLFKIEPRELWCSGLA